MNKILIPTSEDVEGNGEFIAKILKRKSFGWALIPRRRPGKEFLDQNVKKTVKHGGGSVNVWGCITPCGVRHLHCVVGNMNAGQYCKILTESLLGTLGDYEMVIGDIIFQQDNNPKHTARKTKAWFAKHHV
jgi:hypothetical protein